MTNPFEVWRKLRDIYLKYIDTGLPIGHKELEDERKALLLETDAICKWPIIELTKKYPELCTVEEACLSAKLDTGFAEFAKSGLFPDRNGEKSKLYPHQYQAFHKAAAERKNIIATTGTGSGKTECFLLPLLYDIYCEKKKNQGKGDTPSAIRGLILYPLNALAEDQMRRLRRTLSSEAAIRFMDEKLGGQRITFGRYTGVTPISGRKNPTNRSRLNKELDDLTEDWKKAKQIADTSGDSDYLFDIPNMDSGVKAEYWDRWTMQHDPPDIFITNYSMLNIILMRQHEENIFDQTRKWLKSDPSNVFHLVIDELHSYKGTSGTEVAYLIKLLLIRLDLTPDSPQVQFLCSSASMQTSDRTKRFVTGFFGVNEPDYEQSFVMIQDEARAMEMGDFEKLDLGAYLRLTDVTDNIVIKSRFAKDDILGRLKSVVKRAEPSENIAMELFGSSGGDAMLALENILKNLYLLTNEKGEVQQPIRAHYFFRNIDGLWACSNPNCTEIAPEYKYEDRKIGRLYRNSQVTCKCGCSILEVLLCRQCGELYLGGWESRDQKGSMLTVEREIFNDKAQYFTIYPSNESE